MGGVLATDERMERCRRGSRPASESSRCTEFLGDVGGYSQAEIDAMPGTPAWELRKQVVHTVPRELRAELGYALDSRALAAVQAPVLMLLGSESPAWAQRSTPAYAEGFPDARVRPLEGHGHGAAVSGPELLATELAGFLGSLPN